MRKGMQFSSRQHQEGTRHIIKRHQNKTAKQQIVDRHLCRCKCQWGPKEAGLMKKMGASSRVRVAPAAAAAAMRLVGVSCLLLTLLLPLLALCNSASAGRNTNKESQLHHSLPNHQRQRSTRQASTHANVMLLDHRTLWLASTNLNGISSLKQSKRQIVDNTTKLYGSLIEPNNVSGDIDDDNAENALLPAPAAQMSNDNKLAQVGGVASIDSQGLTKQQMEAYAIAQEANRIANKLNAEMCMNFSIGIQYETGGIFTSPDYPNPYPLNLNCTRVIEAPLGHYIVLEFRDQFNIEEAGKECDSDKIQIRDGRYGYSTPIYNFCGTEFPPEIRSTNEALWLRFISDGSITHNGFKAVYRFEKQRNTKPNPPSECRFNVTEMSQFPTLGNNTENRTSIHSGVIRHTDISSQLLTYSKDFNVSLECIWNITVMPGWKIYLVFPTYDLSKPNDCDSNFIEIYEENLTEENQTVKFCGTRTEPQQSKSNIFNIRFHALPGVTSSKFEIIYTAFRDRGIEGCDAREFDCDDGTCIHESLKCDGQNNCKYRYDENSESGPCQNGDPEGTFFETEHMVIILIVFLTLVGGMCASIIVSCWGKIQERRRRKLEYHIRKSREASMEGQLNKAGQIIYGSNDVRQPQANTNIKQRLAAPIRPAESAIQQMNSKYSLENQANGSQMYLGPDSLQQQQHLLSGVQFQQHPLMSQMINTEGGNYGIFGIGANQSGNQMMSSDISSLDTKVGIGQKDEMKQSNINKSLQNIKQSMLLNMASQQAGDLSQQQQSVPDISYNNQFKLQSVVNNSNQMASVLPTNEALTQEAQHLQQQQQMLNISLTRNHLNQQQQQKLINNPIYQQQNQLDNTSNSNNGNSSNNPMSVDQYGRYLRHQQNVNGGPIIDNIPGGILNQPASAQTMPISLAKYNSMLQAQLGAQHLASAQQDADTGQQLNYDTSAGSQFVTASAYNPQRALTLSTLHQPLFNNQLQQQQQQQQRNLQAIYGINPNNLVGNNLSSSITCCNLVDETPLLGDLLQRANHQQRVQFPQNNRIYELRSSTINPRLPTTAIPRSISAHQLSKSQLRQTQNQQRQQQQLHQRQQQQQSQQHHQLPYKSISDAGHANKHQPPNHSLSYPHACTGSHLDNQQRGGQQSPALPPPPPPPNLSQARSQTACGSLPIGQQQTDSRRAAFKVSRLDQSQLTGDTLQDSDMMMANLPLGSMQLDEVSTESDGTFGLMMNPLGLNSMQPITGQQQIRQIARGATQPQQMLYLTQGVQGSMVPTQRILSHLSECNLIRRQRSLINRQEIPQAGIQSMVCNCGALDRANMQMRQQQLQLAASSSHEFDDSDDVACMVQPAGNLTNMELNAMMSTIGHQHPKSQQQHSSFANESPCERQAQAYARFRQQSSELTGDEDDDEIERYNDDQDDDASSDALPTGNVGDSAKVIEYRSRPVVRNEALRDGPGRHLSGSHTSISCQSCTCGSQLRLDQAGVDDESSETKSNGDGNAITNQSKPGKKDSVKESNLKNEKTALQRKDSRLSGATKVELSNQKSLED